MTNFQKRIKETLARVDPQHEAIDTGDAFTRVLHEFKATLEAEKPFVRVRIEQGGHPQMLHLITYPTCRRDERSIMLSLWRDPRGMMRVGGDEGAVFASPQELEKYLINFLENTAFPVTLAWYDKRCSEDVDAFLRTNDVAATNLTSRDVLVVVRASDQWKLATAAPGTEVEMVVRPEKLPTTGSYDQTARYLYLSSSGFAMRIGEHRRAGENQIALKGTVLSEEESGT